MHVTLPRFATILFKSGLLFLCSFSMVITSVMILHMQTHTLDMRRNLYGGWTTFYRRFIKVCETMSVHCQSTLNRCKDQYSQ